MGNIYAVPSHIAAEWDPRVGAWSVSLPPTVASIDLVKARDFLLETQKQRRLGLMAGDLRDDLDRSVDALRKMKFVYRPAIDSTGRAILHEGAHRDNPSRTFNFPKLLKGAKHG